VKILNNHERWNVKLLIYTDKNSILYVWRPEVNRKLTLSLDSEVIDFAHDFSKKSNKPISKIIESYFMKLRQQYETDLPKDLEGLYGIFGDIKVPGKKELRRVFHEKHSN
jgi:hypothetical protein